MFNRFPFDMFGGSGGKIGAATGASAGAIIGGLLFGFLLFPGLALIGALVGSMVGFVFGGIIGEFTHSIVEFCKNNDCSKQNNDNQITLNENDVSQKLSTNLVNQQLNSFNVVDTSTIQVNKENTQSKPENFFVQMFNQATNFFDINISILSTQDNEIELTNKLGKKF
jgi:phage tail tape-measure protein